MFSQHCSDAEARTITALYECVFTKSDLVVTVPKLLGNTFDSYWDRKMSAKTGER